MGSARDTVRKYAYATQPPTKKISAQELSATQIRNPSQLARWTFALSI